MHAADVATSRSPVLLRPCPLCAAADPVVRHRSTAGPESLGTSEHYVPTYAIVGLHGTIVKCRRCGFQYVGDPPDEAMLDRLYAEMADPNYVEECDADDPADEALLDEIECHRRHDGRILEIGCATGTFLMHAARCGWEVRGIEPSRWMARYAREAIGAGAVHVGGYADDAFRERPFDVVIASGLLEHVLDPAHLIRDIHARLASNGLLYLATPNAGCLAARVMGRSWWYVQLPHLSYFTPRTLARLLADCDFEVLWMRTPPHTMGPTTVRHRLQALPTPARTLVASLWRRHWRLRVPLGDHLCVLCRRGPGGL